MAELRYYGTSKLSRRVPYRIELKFEVSGDISEVVSAVDTLGKNNIVEKTSSTFDDESKFLQYKIQHDDENTFSIIFRYLDNMVIFVFTNPDTEQLVLGFIQEISQKLEERQTIA